MLSEIQNIKKSGHITRPLYLINAASEILKLSDLIKDPMIIPSNFDFNSNGNSYKNNQLSQASFSHIRWEFLCFEISKNIFLADKFR